MMQLPLSRMISACTREMSAPGRRRSVSLLRPIVKSGLSMATMRRPSASVTTRRGAGPADMEYRGLYAIQADHRVRGHAVQRLANPEKREDRAGRNRPGRPHGLGPEGLRAVRIGAHGRRGPRA